MTSLITSVYDYLVIGGGSGGIASARRAAQYGAKTALIEHSRLGGTCVNVGCVPKKVMWNASSLMESIHFAKDYGIETTFNKLDFLKLKQKRDSYIKRLNDIYKSNLEKSNVDTIFGKAQFYDTNTIKVDGKYYKGNKILIATGGYPKRPNIPGQEYGIDSDGFFELESLPKRVAVVGAGYIALELSNMLKLFGSDVTLCIRKQNVLRNFDSSIGETVLEEMTNSGINVEKNFISSEVKKNGDVMDLYSEDGRVLKGYDSLLWAIGRSPNIEALGIDKVGIKTDDNNNIIVNEWQETNIKDIYAVGDVTGRFELTPVAIAAGRRLSDRLFGGKSESKLEYSCIPSVIFCHPPAGSVGLSEEEAKAKYGSDSVKVYKTVFTNMFYSLSEKKSKTMIKMICHGEDERIVGLHIVGLGADEMLQGFAVAIKMGATKKDFNNTIAIHPTASEEVVLL